MATTRQLQWSVIENFPHTHLANQRVLRISNSLHNSHAVLKLEMLQLLTGVWTPLWQIPVNIQNPVPEIERLKDYAEYLFIGNTGAVKE